METETSYAVGDALPDALAELTPTLVGGGHVNITVHDLTRYDFDRISGDEQHFPADGERPEFWSRNGFEWRNDRHVVYVRYFTNEPPVVRAIDGSS
jgi:hypothetical protein